MDDAAMTKQADEAGEPLQKLVQVMLDRKYSAERIAQNVSRLFRVRDLVAQAVPSSAIFCKADDL